MNPFSHEVFRFNPFDPLQQLVSRTDLNFDLEFRLKIFRERIKVSLSEAFELGYFPVIHELPHSQFIFKHFGKDVGPIYDNIFDNINHSSIVTIRNPIDSYLSTKNGWLGEVKGFDEYCHRLDSMLEFYSNSPIIKYENFVQNRWK